MSKINLLAIVEQGGYPDFSPLYQDLGCKVNQLSSLRKSISYIKKNKINILIAEYNYQTQFRDRTSSIESIMASLQPYPDVKVIVFIDKAHEEHFLKVSCRFDIFETLTFPIDTDELKEKVTKAMQFF